MARPRSETVEAGSHGLAGVLGRFVSALLGRSREPKGEAAGMQLLDRVRKSFEAGRAIGDGEPGRYVAWLESSEVLNAGTLDEHVAIRALISSEIEPSGVRGSAAIDESGVITVGPSVMRAGGYERLEIAFVFAVEIPFETNLEYFDEFATAALRRALADPARPRRA